MGLPTPKLVLELESLVELTGVVRFVPALAVSLIDVELCRLAEEEVLEASFRMCRPAPGIEGAPRGRVLVAPFVLTDKIEETLGEGGTGDVAAEGDAGGGNDVWARGEVGDLSGIGTFSVVVTLSEEVEGEGFVTDRDSGEGRRGDDLTGLFDAFGGVNVDELDDVTGDGEEMMEPVIEVDFLISPPLNDDLKLHAALMNLHEEVDMKDDSPRRLRPSSTLQITKTPTPRSRTRSLWEEIESRNRLHCSVGIRSLTTTTTQVRRRHRAIRQRTPTLLRHRTLSQTRSTRSPHRRQSCRVL
jgi:hypothetical protein